MVLAPDGADGLLGRLHHGDAALAHTSFVSSLLVSRGLIILQLEVSNISMGTQILHQRLVRRVRVVLDAVDGVSPLCRPRRCPHIRRGEKSERMQA